MAYLFDEGTPVSSALVSGLDAELLDVGGIVHEIDDDVADQIVFSTGCDPRAAGLGVADQRFG